MRQGHVFYSSIFGIYDLNLVEIDIKLSTLSHLDMADILINKLWLKTVYFDHRHVHMTS